MSAWQLGVSHLAGLRQVGVSDLAELRQLGLGSQIQQLGNLLGALNEPAEQVQPQLPS